MSEIDTNMKISPLAVALSFFSMVAYSEKINFPMVGTIQNVATQKEMITSEIFRKMKTAENDATVDSDEICDEIKEATKYHIFDKTHISRLIEFIQFPSTAKKPNASSDILINPSDIQTPTGQALLMIGKEAADECLKEIGRSQKISKREIDLYLVASLIYGPNAENMVRKELGSRVDLFNEITNKK
jgi:hypothetical protein